MDSYSVFIVGSNSRRSGMNHSFTCKSHHTCLYLVSVHQTSPPLTEVADIKLQIASHLFTPKGWKADRVSWLTVYHVVTRQLQAKRRTGKARQRPTFYHCPMQPTQFRNRWSQCWWRDALMIHLPGCRRRLEQTRRHQQRTAKSARRRRSRLRLRQLLLREGWGCPAERSSAAFDATAARGLCRQTWRRGSTTRPANDIHHMYA